MTAEERGTVDGIRSDIAAVRELLEQRLGQAEKQLEEHDHELHGRPGNGKGLKGRVGELETTVRNVIRAAGWLAAGGAGGAGLLQLLQ